MMASRHSYSLYWYYSSFSCHESVYFRLQNRSANVDEWQCNPIDLSMVLVLHTVITPDTKFIETMNILQAELEKL